LFGYLDPVLLLYIARCLRLPTSHVYGVAIFDNYFTLKPKGEHTRVVWVGTACYVKGANQLLAAMEQFAGIKASETSRDGKLWLVTARCIGACGVAPAVVGDRAGSRFCFRRRAVQHRPKGTRTSAEEARRHL
jgi:bidirectional [NiFe] hydrogenase diaphorase subunit